MEQKGVMHPCKHWGALGLSVPLSQLPVYACSLEWSAGLPALFVVHFSLSLLHKL